MTTEQYANLAASALNGDITAGATSFAVASAASFPPHAQFRIKVDQELMLVTADPVGNTFTSVTRGAEGTTAVSHSNGATVTHVVTVASLIAAIQFYQAIQSLTLDPPLSSTGGQNPVLSFSLIGQAHGDILYFDGTNWTRLPAGTVGQFLKTRGSSADPQWATIGGLTSVQTTAIDATVNVGAMCWTDVTSGTKNITPPTLAAGVTWGVKDWKALADAGHAISIANAAHVIEDPNSPGTYTTDPILIETPSMVAIWQSPDGVTYGLIG